MLAKTTQSFHKPISNFFPNFTPLVNHVVLVETQKVYEPELKNHFQQKNLKTHFPKFLRMSGTSTYLSNYDGHVCDVENYIIRTSLKLHTFGRRFYPCRYWSPDDDRSCKFFKWLDTSICCTRGAATVPIVIAKFKRLEYAVEVAEEELKQAHTLIDAALERERVAK